MKRRAGFLVGLCLVASIQLTSREALAARDQTRPDEMEVALDLVVARPIGILMAAVGSVFFVLTVPFSLIGGNVGESADVLVFGPYKEVLVRCLGCRREGRYRIAKAKKEKKVKVAKVEKVGEQKVATASPTKRKRRKRRGIGY